MDEDTRGDHEDGLSRLEGRVLADRYRVAHVVSSGANTIILESIDTVDDKPVTVKIVNPERLVHASFRDDFRTQIEIATSLSHPNIAAVLDWGEVEIDGETTLFWVVDYLGGGSLRDLYDRGRLLEPSQALVVGLEACRALDAAHSRGVVHTELTPSKLVFGDDARLRVVDLAMAELLGREAWEEPATVATHVARYASPEQALSLDVDAKTDVYALCLCLIEGITGTVPFAGDSTVSTLAARVGKLMPVTADMGSLAAVLERAGRPEAEDRWTAEEFGAALVQAAGKLPRPEPIPIMPSSLFAASVAQRRALRDLDVDPSSGAETAEASVQSGDVDAPPPVVPLTEPPSSGPEGASTGVEPMVADTDVGSAPVATDDDESTSADQLADDAPALDDVGTDAAAAALPLLLLTDISDPPTGAVQVAGPDASDPAGPEPTQQLPDSAAADAAMATTPPTEPLAVVDPTPTGTIYDEERQSRRWGRIVAVTLVVILGIAALSYAGWLLLRTKSYEVPDLVGVDEAVALNEISGNGWVVETDRERSDEVPEVDHVVRTNPVAGEMLDEGDTFVIVVSDGPELRTIPELAGMTLDDVQATLADLRLLVIEAPPVFSETVPAGTVVSWQVQDDAALVAGAQVLPETTIVVTVSKGPEPRPAPDLTNQTVDEATATLEDLQLVIAQGEDEFSDSIEVGRVVSQEPSPTTPVPRDGTVTVRVSKGPDLVPIPDLAGQTYQQAQQSLSDAGFTIDSLLGTTEGTFVSISVGGDEVQAGATFPRGTGVDLVFL